MCKKVVVGVETGRATSFDELFKKEDNYLGAYGTSPWFDVKENLKKYNIFLTDIDDDTVNIDIALFFDNIDGKTYKKHKNVPKIYFQYEPWVRDVNNSKKNLRYLCKFFECIFTFDDDIIELANKKMVKYCVPMNLYKPQNTEKGFCERKLLTSVFSNNFIRLKGELISERKKISSFFQQRPGDDYDYYGTGFITEDRNYKGIANSKYEAYQNYKFAICFENNKITYGNITEKIFDCFAAGIVPIYYGAPNIEDYIPQECYIDYRQFGSVEECVNYLMTISKDEWRHYIEAKDIFLASAQCKCFSPQDLAEKLAKAVMNIKPCTKPYCSVLKVAWQNIKSDLINAYIGYPTLVFIKKLFGKIIK